jgi:hypothetical protein
LPQGALDLQFRQGANFAREIAKAIRSKNVKNSFIFSSNACKACDDKPFEPSERDVLRTTTEDICCTCGAVLQTFPAMTGFIPAQNAIPIPKAVSEVLEKLLKRRLFILGKGAQPRRTDHSFFDSERMAKTLAHRAGEQIYMTLRGPGNCSAELRWNASFSHF